MPLRNWAEMVAESEKDGGSNTRQPVPADKYNMVVTAAQHQTSSTGKDGYNLTTEIEDGPHKGRLVWDTHWVSPENPKALAIFFRHMDVLGLSREGFFSTDPSDEQICAALVGKRFIGTVTIGTKQNGEPRNEIKNYATPVPGVGGPVPGVPTPGAGPALPTPTQAQPPQASAAPAMPPQAPVAPQAPVQAPVAPPAAAAPPAAPQAPVAAAAVPPTPAASEIPAAPASPWDAQPQVPGAVAENPWDATPPPAPPLPAS